MKTIVLISLLVMASCNTLPQLYQATEEIANDEAIKVAISKEAIQKETNLKVSIDLTNSTQK